ncbi:MAG: hypothetical protein JSR56_00865 [Proteobacteria bacterium]|nr:hypothetical protein [Pseudomonadota bacterium]
MATNRPAFLSELRRRNVLRAVVLYAGATWALAQGISQLTPAIGLPDPATRWFLIVAVIGFPFWVAFAWFYEFTPQGIKRESEVPPGESTTHRTARKLDLAIMGVLAIAVVLLASGYFIRRQPITIGPRGNGHAAFDPPKDSLVVLPFRNLSGDPKQQYFSDGITEELTGALGQNPALQVIAWGTAATFRDTAQSASDIGQRLNVANVLHGSILRDGNDVRITAELVNTVTGYELWSAHYDGTFKDIFKVQDQVSEAIAHALQVRFAKPDQPANETGSPEAHDLVLKGKELLNRFDAGSLVQAKADFEKAIAIDPEYAGAHAMLADAILAMTQRADLPLDSALPRIRAEADRALTLDPRNSDVWVTLGMADSNTSPPDVARARAELQKALELNPSNSAAHTDYSNILPLRKALLEVQEATLLSPDDQAAWNNLVTDAQDVGDWKLEIQGAETRLKLDPANADSAFALAFARQQLHQYDQMVAAFDRVRPSNPLDAQQIDAGRLVYRSLVDPAIRTRALAAIRQLAAHQSNQDVAGNLLQLYLALGETEPAQQLLEVSCPTDPVGCSDLAVNPMYQSLRGNLRFQKLEKKYNTTTVD